MCVLTFNLLCIPSLEQIKLIPNKHEKETKLNQALTFHWVDFESGVLIAWNDSVSHWLIICSIFGKGRQRDNFWPYLKWFWDLYGVLWAQKQRLVVTQDEHMYGDLGKGEKVARKASICGFHSHLKDGLGLIR